MNDCSRLAAAGLVLVTAACGGSPSSHVAHFVPTASKTAKHTQLQGEYSSFARCMRSHGIGSFPDPVTGTGGHPGFHLQGGPNGGLNGNDPAFQRAIEGCQHILGHRFQFVLDPNGQGKGA